MIRRPPRSTLFPYTRSSDLADFHAVVPVLHPARRERQPADRARDLAGEHVGRGQREQQSKREGEDRKSTRLNSSHSQISYAVFCLKKKKDHLKANGSECPGL